MQGSRAGPDYLVLNHLPFAEDLRVAKFTAFDEKTEYLPSEEQLNAMSELVRSLDLRSGSTASFVHGGYNQRLTIKDDPQQSRKVLPESWGGL